MLVVALSRYRVQSHGCHILVNGLENRIHGVVAVHDHLFDRVTGLTITRVAHLLKIVAPVKTGLAMTEENLLKAIRAIFVAVHRHRRAQLFGQPIAPCRLLQLVQLVL